MTVGCASPPAVEITGFKCVRVEQDGHLKAIDFVCCFETDDLQGTQLVYQVRLQDRYKRLIHSHDGSYEKYGFVAASRTVMVMKDPHVFTNIQVSIPARELELLPSHFPVKAEMSIYRANGECLSRSAALVPLSSAQELLPPIQLEEPGGESREYDVSSGPPKDKLDGPIAIDPTDNRSKSLVNQTYDRVVHDRIVKTRAFFRQLRWFVCESLVSSCQRMITTLTTELHSRYQRIVNKKVDVHNKTAQEE